MKSYRDHLITPQNITVVFSEGPPISITRDDNRFERLLELIKTHHFEQITQLVDKPTLIREHTKGKFTVTDGVVVIDEEQLPIALSDKLLEFVDQSLDTRPLENFWHNLKKNPLEASKRDLFEFMRANKMPITPAGNFIAYKRVKDDYYDFHTGTLHNAPGKILKMEREEVNSDRNQTCSHGLHVAAYEYADKHYHANQGIMLEVEVNPKDVVAVPPDYKQQKMRVCRYKVIGLATKEILDLVYQPINK